MEEIAQSLEVQQVESTADSNNLSGNFRLRFNGQTTEDIPFDATKAVVTAKLQRLSTIGAVTESDALLNAVAWFKSTVLTG